MIIIAGKSDKNIKMASASYLISFRFHNAKKKKY